MRLRSGVQRRGLKGRWWTGRTETHSTTDGHPLAGRGSVDGDVTTNRSLQARSRVSGATMQESEDWNDDGALATIQTLVARSVELQESEETLERELADLARRRTEGTSSLLEFASTANTYARQQTEMAAERTSLTREQTRLSTRSTELSNIRTDFARERSSLAGQRTDLAVHRTNMARDRTALARERTGLSGQRTELAQLRNRLAEGRNRYAERRTGLSTLRTELAWGRTYLALIRTGLAFLVLGVSLFRYFGLSWWSLFDGVLALGSVVIVVWGGRGYHRATVRMRAATTALASRST